MNKNTYLRDLRDLLNQYTMDEITKEDIIKDYDSLWDQYEALQMSDDDIVLKLGKPKDIIDALADGFIRIETKKTIQKRSAYKKVIALTPFISVMLFFAIGFLIPNGFAFAWITFLSIPMTAIILEGPRNMLQKLTALSPFIALIIFFPILGFWLNVWHPGWLIFFITPIIGGLNQKNVFKRYLVSGGLFVTAILYLIADQLLNLGQLTMTEYIVIPYSSFVFLPMVIVLVYLQISSILKNGIQYLILLILSISIYLFLSLQYDLWVISWLVFFIIPLYAIYKTTSKNDRLIAIMPFISTTLFMLLGYFFNAWAFAWMVYLLIPMVAIIKKT